MEMETLISQLKDLEDVNVSMIDDLTGGQLEGEEGFVD